MKDLNWEKRQRKLHLGPHKRKLFIGQLIRDVTVYFYSFTICMIHAYIPSYFSYYLILISWIIVCWLASMICLEEIETTFVIRHYKHFNPTRNQFNEGSHKWDIEPVKRSLFVRLSPKQTYTNWIPPNYQKKSLSKNAYLSNLVLCVFTPIS